MRAMCTVSASSEDIVVFLHFLMDGESLANGYLTVSYRGGFWDRISQYWIDHVASFHGGGDRNLSFAARMCEPDLMTMLATLKWNGVELMDHDRNPLIGDFLEIVDGMIFGAISDNKARKFPRV